MGSKCRRRNNVSSKLCMIIRYCRKLMVWEFPQRGSMAVLNLAVDCDDENLAEDERPTRIEDERRMTMALENPSMEL